MKTKRTVGIIFGGRSAEHEVSIHSAKNIIDALDKDKFRVICLGITKEGRWVFGSEAEKMLSTTFKKFSSFEHMNLEKQIILSPNLPSNKTFKEIDVIFPVIHGPYGEDGTLQGFLRLIDIPFVGSDVLGSAIGMDKDVTKRLLIQAGIPVVKYNVFSKHNKSELNFKSVKDKFGSVFFVKPANLGSSVGVNKVVDEDNFIKAIDNAFEFDSKILIEEAIDAREIECSVLGNDEPETSVLGEIIPNHDFYSYESKYIDQNGATFKIPADLGEELTNEIKTIAIKAFKTLCCKGMARVDFFLERNTNRVYLNELNTIPGFTNISMYPALWKASGKTYSQLIEKLLDLALEHHSELQSHKVDL